MRYESRCFVVNKFFAFFFFLTRGRMHVMAPGKVTLCFAVLVLALALHTTVVRAEAEAEVELTYVKEVTNVAKFQAFIAKHKYVAVEAYTGCSFFLLHCLWLLGLPSHYRKVSIFQLGEF
jgi:hypothetical protein